MKPDEELQKNLRYWSKWGTTPPSMTKSVAEFGRKFTAISAYWQIGRATELWGPIGEGWGWDTPEWEILFPDDSRNSMLLFTIRFWVGDPASKGVVLLNSQKMFFKDGQKLDDDIFKKLLTDTVTKFLSYMGCSSDVFTGLFDDSRYLQKAQRDEHEAKQAKERAPDPKQHTQAHVEAQRTPANPEPESDASLRMSLYRECVAAAKAGGMPDNTVPERLKAMGHGNLKGVPIAALREILAFLSGIAPESEPESSPSPAPATAPESAQEKPKRSGVKVDPEILKLLDSMGLAPLAADVMKQVAEHPEARNDTMISLRWKSKIFADMLEAQREFMGADAITSAVVDAVTERLAQVAQKLDKRHYIELSCNRWDEVARYIIDRVRCPTCSDKADEPAEAVAPEEEFLPFEDRSVDGESEGHDPINDIDF